MVTLPGEALTLFLPANVLFRSQQGADPLARRAALQQPVDAAVGLPVSRLPEFLFAKIPAAKSCVHGGAVGVAALAQRRQLVAPVADDRADLSGLLVGQAEILAQLPEVAAGGPSRSDGAYPGDWA